MSNALHIFDLSDLPEKPWQRIAASMFATGSAVHEIAAQLAQPAHLISDYLSSERGKTLIKEVLSANAERLDGLLEAAAVDSLLTLIRIRDTSPNDTARISASKAILEKVLPSVKAKEPKRNAGTAITETTEEEIERLRKRVHGSI